MRVASALGGNRGQQNPLLMMGRHVPPEVLVDGWVVPSHGNSRSYAAKSAAAASIKIPKPAPRPQVRRNMLPSNVLRLEDERRSHANSGYTDAEER
jgi:hypothetical protein